jgi:hypothetical protein
MDKLQKQYKKLRDVNNVEIQPVTTLLEYETGMIC